MEVSLIPFLVKAVPRAAAALVASSLVVSCATSTEAPQATATGRNPSVAADVNLERVVLQAYRAIGDRHLFEPNFRSLSTETYRGFASADPSMVLETSDGIKKWRAFLEEAADLVVSHGGSSLLINLLALGVLLNISQHATADAGAATPVPQPRWSAGTA